MKLCIVYSPYDSKLHPKAYCSVFKDMLYALRDKFNCRCYVVGDCNAKDINADVIFFFDPHATHHVKIEGIEKHPAIKIEYWNDVQQEELRGIHKTTGVKVHKLGRDQRAERAKRRGTRYIVSATKEYFLRFFGDRFNNAEDMLLHFPHAPATKDVKPYPSREPVVLGNGATWGSALGGYEFRTWAHEQPYIKHVPHKIKDPNTPAGEDYISFLAEHMGALALCDNATVPKYYEIPAAGCVTFARHHQEYEDFGFKDMESCVYVTRLNFKERVNDFLNNVQEYQPIADAGRKLFEDNYTAGHFADFIYETVSQ